MDRITAHVRIVAILNIVVGVFYLLSTAMILYNLSMREFPTRDHDFAVAVVWVMTALALPNLLVGIGLLLRFRFARFAAILLGIVHLFELPVGTPVGLYALWLFLMQDTDGYFRKGPPPELKIYSGADADSSER